MLIAQAAKTFIVEEGLNPSTDYFVLPQLKSTKEDTIRCTWRDLPDPEALTNSSIIFVRYVPNNWRQLVNRTRMRLKRLIYFMDDDLFDFSASRGLSLRYRYKLLRFATQKRDWLLAMNAEIWVSSDWLLKKYAALQPQLVLPQPLANRGNPRRVFYHGSASHHDEIVWLYPVLKEVLKQDQLTCFEIIGNTEINRLYRNLPRVNVIHPMKWPSYQSFIASPGRHVGLAPSLDNAFNQARSYTKFFDITRAGAVGIYAELGPAKNVITHRTEGLLVKMTPSAWIDAILQLTQQESERQQMLIQARHRISLFKSSPPLGQQARNAV
jgi:hypothetical protein